MIGVAAVLLGLAVLGLVRPRRLHLPRSEAPPRAKKQWRIARPHDIDLGVLALEVSTRLRAGMSVERAWDVSLTRAGFPPLTPVLDEEGCPRALAALDRERGPIATLKALVSGQPRISPLTRVALPSLLAASRLSWRTGAPVADVLDECAEGLTEAGEAQSARQIAMSGPKSTATMLAWLPVVGLGLGLVMGVNPVGFLLTTGLGRVCLVIGLAAEFSGIAWVRRLVRRAETEGAIGS